MRVSMVISTYNRADLLDHSLRRLSELTLPEELLVIDDGGEDHTAEVCERWSEHIPLRYIYNHNPGRTICSMARNIGIKEAIYDFIVTAEPELLFLTDIIAQFQDLQPEYPDEVISAGHVWFAPEGYHGDDIESGQSPSDYAPPAGSQDAIGWVAPYTALWYRPWLMEVGGWDEGFPGPWGWDDSDVLTRLRINGHGQHIDLDCKAVHQFHGLGGDQNFINEAHFFRKSFTHGQENHRCSDECPKRVEDLTDLIANGGHEWGKVKSR